MNLLAKIKADDGLNKRTDVAEESCKDRIF